VVGVGPGVEEHARLRGPCGGRPPHRLAARLLARVAAEKPGELLAQAVEAERAHEFVDGGAIGPAELHPGPFDRKVDLEIAPEFDEPATAPDGLGGLADRLSPLALQFVGVLEQVLEGSVPHHQFGRGLGTDPGHAGHVVHGVPHQGEHVGHLTRLEAGPAEQSLGADEVVGLRVEEAGPLVEQLGEVLVAAQDPNLERGVLPVPERHEARDRVVGLHPLDRHHRDVEGSQQFETSLDLRAEVLRRRLAVGLVLRIDLRSKGAPIAARIDRHREMFGTLLPQHLDEHVREPEDQIRRLAGQRAAHRRADRVVGAEELGVPVDQMDRAVAHQPVRPAACSASRRARYAGPADTPLRDWAVAMTSRKRSRR
jgi:hypothetical protein